MTESVPVLYVMARALSQPTYHAVDLYAFFAAIHRARHSSEIAAAHKPQAKCGVQVLMDRFARWKPWAPGGDTCTTCEKALNP